MKKLTKLKVLLFISVIAVLSAIPACASTGTGLAWENPLNSVQKSMSGPVAFAICIVGFVGGFGTLIFGGELSEFTRRAIYVAAAGGVLVAAPTMVSTLFGVSGALV
jgi:type IV secretory pathway VirB2 component (pilin)